MIDSPIGAKQATFGLDLRFSGDNHMHQINLPYDVEGSWDKDSQVLTVNLHSGHAAELYWQLLEIIPALRKDRG